MTSVCRMAKLQIEQQQRCLSSASTKLSSHLSAVSSATISAPAAKPTMLQIVSGPRACVCLFARSNPKGTAVSRLSVLRAPPPTLVTSRDSGLGGTLTWTRAPLRYTTAATLRVCSVIIYLCFFLPGVYALAGRLTSGGSRVETRTAVLRVGWQPPYSPRIEHEVEGRRVDLCDATREGEQECQR